MAGLARRFLIATFESLIIHRSRFPAGGEGGARLFWRDLKTKDRILLHLSDLTRYAEGYDAPPEATQFGIAQTVGIRAGNASEYIRPLVRGGLAVETVRHIRGSARRRKAYFLTTNGSSTAAFLRQALLDNEVPFRRRSGKLETRPLSKVLMEDRRGATLLSLVRELEGKRFIRETVIDSTVRPVEFLAQAPPRGAIQGRTQEMKKILEAVERTPLVSVTGFAGIGKTTLAANVCERLRGSRPLFWRRIQSWDSASRIVRNVAEFLRALDRTDLYHFMTAPGRKELGALEELIASDLVGTRAVLVFDDVHVASKDAIAFFCLLFAVLKELEGVSAVTLSREVPSFFSRRDVEIERTVAEVPLRGLDHRSSRAILAEMGIHDGSASRFVEISGGNPLFLKLLARAGGEAEDLGSAVMRDYIMEQIEPALSEEQLSVLELASFYAMPVPARALQTEGHPHSRAVLVLHRKGLIDRLVSGRYLLHDFLRDHFRDRIPPSRRESLADASVGWLEKESMSLMERGDWAAAIPLLENAARIDHRPLCRASHWHQLGHAESAVGDVPEAMQAFRAALALAPGGALGAELHDHVASCLDSLGEWDQANAEVRRGFELLPTEPCPAEVHLLMTRAMINFHSRRDYDQVLIDLDRAQWLIKTVAVSEWLRIQLLFFRGAVLLTVGRPSEAIPILDEAAVASARAKDLWPPCWIYADLAICYLELGRCGEARAALNKGGLASATVGDSGPYNPWFLVNGWYLAHVEGRLAEAETAFSEAYRRAKKSYDPVRVVWQYKHLADLYRSQGRLREAIESLRYFLTVSRGIINEDRRFEATCLLVRLLLDAGDPDAATDHLREAERIADKEPDLQIYHLEWGRAAIWACRGDSNQADACFRKALDSPITVVTRAHIEETLATPTHKGELLLDYARFLVSRGDRARGKRILAQAIQELDEHCLTPLSKVGRELLQTLDAKDTEPFGDESPDAS